MKRLSINDIPKGYVYAAIDADGEAWAYVKKPVLKEEITYAMWTSSDDSCLIDSNFDSKNWQNSLICNETD